VPSGGERSSKEVYDNKNKLGHATSRKKNIKRCGSFDVHLFLKSHKIIYLVQHFDYLFDNTEGLNLHRTQHGPFFFQIGAVAVVLRSIVTDANRKVIPADSSHIVYQAAFDKTRTPTRR
jgi:hypothetical protein